MDCLSGLPAVAGWYGEEVIFGVVKINKGVSEGISSDAPLSCYGMDGRAAHYACGWQEFSTKVGAQHCCDRKRTADDARSNLIPCRLGAVVR